MQISLNRFKFFIPIIIGIAAFFIVAGPLILNPLNIYWLQGGTDPSQHYIGWVFFRNSTWILPIGLNPNYGMAFSNSIVFSDSIPLLAILFKLLSLFLSSPFQYFGIWTLLCFVLQAYFGWKLIGLVTTELWIQLLGTILFVFSPPMMARVGIHSALVGHFLILAGIYLNFRPNQDNRILYWAVLILSACLIHFYLLIMVLALWAASFCDVYFLSKKIDLKKFLNEILIIFSSLPFFMWQAGYFSINSSATDVGGYGFFRMNLLALFNSVGFSYFLPTFFSSMDNGEGFNFFGTGALLIFIFAIFGFIFGRLEIKKYLHKYIFLIICCCLLILGALTNNIGVSSVDYSFYLPNSFISILSVARASGRLFWPVFYILLFVLICILIRTYSKKVAISILFFASVLQVIDTSAGWISIRKNLTKDSQSAFEPSLKNPFWSAAGLYFSNILRYPTHKFLEGWVVFADFASKYHLQTNSTFLARVDEQKMIKFNQNIRHELSSGTLNPASLYILDDWKIKPIIPIWNPDVDLFAKIDGWNVLAPNWKTCIRCPQLDSSFEIKDFVPPVFLNEPILFTAFGKGRSSSFLLDNWSFSEAWGTWSNGTESSLRLPIPAGHPKTLTISARALVNGVHPSQDMKIMVNGVFVKQVHLTKNDENKITIPILENALSQGNMLIEFKFLNPIKPKDLDMGNDDRLLSIGIKSVVFN